MHVSTPIPSDEVTCMSENWTMIMCTPYLIVFIFVSHFLLAVISNYEIRPIFFFLHRWRVFIRFQKDLEAIVFTTMNQEWPDGFTIECNLIRGNCRWLSFYCCNIPLYVMYTHSRVCWLIESKGGWGVNYYL